MIIARARLALLGNPGANRMTSGFAIGPISLCTSSVSSVVRVAGSWFMPAIGVT